MAQDHWLHGFKYNVEEWFERDCYETLAICRSLAHARAVFKVAVAEKSTGRFMIRSRQTRLLLVLKDVNADANSCHGCHCDSNSMPMPGV